ncbi:MAG TPA: NAD(P)H-dependent oxidoreductase [Candidatus Saccharimonadales bacterium]|nr:NAD(P)H-dependent oxidoreductase [Candidatus Saccharimonadales bacterium]
MDDTDALVLAILVGTSREGRESIKAARWVAEFARQRQGVEVVFVDPTELHLPSDGDEIRDPKYTEITARADAFYVVTPEYNHSYPGSLKRMLDSEYGNYLHKPIGTAGVSSGIFGGARCCEALIPVYHKLGLVVIQPEVYFPKVGELFDEQGNLKLEHVERYTASVGKALDELLWYARLLKRARAAAPEQA